MFGFAGAIERIKNGQRVRRRAWPADMHVAIDPRDSRFIARWLWGEPARWIALSHDLLASDWETFRPPPASPDPPS